MVNHFSRADGWAHAIERRLAPLGRLLGFRPDFPLERFLDAAGKPFLTQAAESFTPVDIGGKPGGTVGEPFNRPLTAHFIGGCTIGESPETGVVDPYQRMFGHPELHVVDGSAISTNLGVNPSLTITAQAERAMAFWPNKGETDARPPLGASYERVGAVAPRRPAVPAEAPAALRLPIVGVS